LRKLCLIIAVLLVGILAFGNISYAASYTVKPGDTLYLIATRNGTSVNTIMSLNGLSSTMIYPGQVLILPDKGTKQYTVQPGDTLYLIAKSFGTSVDTIMSLNGLSSTMIYPGQVLLVPGSGQAPKGNTQYYTVQPGDTLYLIAKSFGTTVDTIMSLNGLSSTMIYPGQVLLVSGSGQAPKGNTQSYTVRAGDTLYLIAKSFGTTVDTIMSLNGLSSTMIYPGQVLLVPAGSGGGTSPPSRGSNYTAEERYLLAQLINAEAAGEIFEGKVAVGAVVLNRIRDPRFPNTITDVIYEPWQFEPVLNGTLYLPPSADSIRAADAALSGWDPVYGAVYFCNPATAQSTEFFKTLTYVCRIGNHVFYK